MCIYNTCLVGLPSCVPIMDSLRRYSTCINLLYILTMCNLKGISILYGYRYFEVALTMRTNI